MVIFKIYNWTVYAVNSVKGKAGLLLEEVLLPEWEDSVRPIFFFLYTF
jgi:hypothetical protein